MQIQKHRTRVRFKLLNRIVAALLLLPLLSGCWDRIEIEERAVVLGVSIDTVSKEEGEKEEDEVSHINSSLKAPKKEMIRLAVQIALPGRIPLGPGMSGGKGSESQTVWVIDVVGHSVDDAISNLQQQVSNKLFFGHLRIIIVSEAMAKRGLEDVNDFFRRNPEVRRMAWMVIAKGEALPLMKAVPKLERVPTLYMISTLDEGIKLGKFPKDYIGVFWSNVSKLGREGVLPYVDMKKEQNIGLKGLAYFVGDKLVGVSNPLEIAGYLGILGENPAGYSTYVQVQGSDAVMVKATQRSSKIKASIKNGVPHFKVDISIDLNLESKLTHDIEINNVDILREIEVNEEKKAKIFYEKLIMKTQNKGSDIFGFGEIIRGKKAGYWNANIKTGENWQKIYKECTFDIGVTIKLRRIGMKAR